MKCEKKKHKRNCKYIHAKNDITCKVKKDRTLVTEEFGICGSDEVCTADLPHLLYPLLGHHTDLTLHGHLHICFLEEL
jgi:hypothetical protein